MNVLVVLDSCECLELGVIVVMSVEEYLLVVAEVMMSCEQCLVGSCNVGGEQWHVSRKVMGTVLCSPPP